LAREISADVCKSAVRRQRAANFLEEKRFVAAEQHFHAEWQMAGWIRSETNDGFDERNGTLRQGPDQLSQAGFHMRGLSRMTTVSRPLCKWSRREELNTPSAKYNLAALTLSYTGDRAQNLIHSIKR